MLKVIGFHEFLHGSADPRNIDDRKPETFKLTVDVNSILSFSVYSNHAVWVNKDGQGYAVGDNRGYAIIGTLQEKEYFETTKFDFIDDEQKPCKLLSVVCGACYTLYHVQPHELGEGTRLAFVEWNKSQGKPLFLNIARWDAIRLFGGRETAAAIGTNGSIVVITDVVFDSPNESPPILFLPGKERASCVACTRTYIFGLSLTGKLSSCHISLNGQIESAFIPVKELEGIKCVQISGMWDHCFAVTEDGRVFAFGTNASGQIGLGSQIKSVNTFTYVETLSQYKIKSAFAGYMHSLFITEDGSVLACGRNSFGQLFLESGSDKNVFYTPIQTSIKSGAKFAIAGPGISAVWIDASPPQDMPNMPLFESDYEEFACDPIHTTLSDDSENSLLRAELMSLRSENASLVAEVERLKKELKESQQNEENQKQKILELEKKIGK